VDTGSVHPKDHAPFLKGKPDVVLRETAGPAVALLLLLLYTEGLQVVVVQ